MRQNSAQCWGTYEQIPPQKHMADVHIHYMGHIWVQTGDPPPLLGKFWHYICNVTLVDVVGVPTQIKQYSVYSGMDNGIGKHTNYDYRLVWISKQAARHVHQPDSEYSARRDSLIVRRVSEFDHLPHIVWPLYVVAVNEEQWLLDASLQQVSVDG